MVATTKSESHEPEPFLVDPSGRPLKAHLNGNANGNGHATSATLDAEMVRKSFMSALSSYAQSLGRLELSPSLRARDPFSNHGWVGAAANLVAVVAGQYPFSVYQETARAEGERAMKMKSAGLPWTGAKAGSGRRSVERYLRRPVVTRLHWAVRGKSAAAEPFPDHPLSAVLADPNPIMTGAQLMQLTFLWLSIRGEFSWLPTNEEGEIVPASEGPARLWPIPPDALSPRLSISDMRGDFLGWWITAPTYLPARLQVGTRFKVEVDELIHFKFPDPSNPLRGLSRLTAGAGAIDSDLIARAHNRATLKNGAKLDGVFELEGAWTADAIATWQKQFSDQHEKVENRGRVPVIGPGIKFNTTGIPPKDLEYHEGMRWNREEILALLGVHKAVLGVTEDLNRATHLAASANFLEMTILPNARIIEDTLDRTLFYPHTDNTFGMFDFTGSDALRAGMTEKIQQARDLSSETLHVPPRVAMVAVGLSDHVEEYEGDDTALVSALATPYAVAVEQAENPIPPPPQFVPGAPPAPAATEPEESPIGEDEEPEKRLRAPAARTTKQTAANRRRRWLRFVRVQSKLEKDMGRRYRSWVTEERNATLARFDAEASKPGATRAAALRDILLKELRLTAILPGLDESGRKLKEKTRPNRAASLDAAYQFTLEDIGIPTFAIDDASILRQFARREDIFARSVPSTLRDNLFRSLQEGIQAGETVQALRSRVAEVYRISAGTPKTLMIARTETASLMNGVRDEMFGLQGLDTLEWVTSGDEHVRDNHKVFGASGAKPKGFDYLTLVGLGGSGALRYPGDSDAPASETVNCRCLAVPA